MSSEGTHHPALTVVIPAYNEERRLGASLGRIVEYLRLREPSWEILVVDDGSRDRTAAVVEEAAAAMVSEGLPPGSLRLLKQPRNQGKGAALRGGVLGSRGEWILLTDADLSTPIDELETLEARRDDADVILGSRAVEGSRITQRQPVYRELMGKTFNVIIRLLGLTSARDTQCGFKLIRGDVARGLFPRFVVDRFAYDVELVWMARRSGYRVVEVGVVWEDSPQSKVHPIRDSWGMFRDVVLLRWRQR